MISKFYFTLNLIFIKFITVAFASIDLLKINDGRVKFCEQAKHHFWNVQYAIDSTIMIIKKTGLNVVTIHIIVDIINIVDSC